MILTLIYHVSRKLRAPGHFITQTCELWRELKVRQNLSKCGWFWISPCHSLVITPTSPKWWCYTYLTKKKARELAVNCIFGTFLLHSDINNYFTLQNLCWNIVCLYTKPENGQIYYRWRVSFNSSMANQPNIHILNTCFLYCLKRFDISNIQNWNMEKKTGNVFQINGLEKQRWELMNTAKWVISTNHSSRNPRAEKHFSF